MTENEQRLAYLFDVSRIAMSRITKKISEADFAEASEDLQKFLMEVLIMIGAFVEMTKPIAWEFGEVTAEEAMVNWRALA